MIISVCSQLQLRSSFKAASKQLQSSLARRALRWLRLRQSSRWIKQPRHVFDPQRCRSVFGRSLRRERSLVSAASGCRHKKRKATSVAASTFCSNLIANRATAPRATGTQPVCVLPLELLLCRLLPRDAASLYGCACGTAHSMASYR